MNIEDFKNYMIYLEENSNIDNNYITIKSGHLLNNGEILDIQDERIDYKYTLSNFPKNIELTQEILDDISVALARINKLEDYDVDFKIDLFIKKRI